MCLSYIPSERYELSPSPMRRIEAIIMWLASRLYEKSNFLSFQKFHFWFPNERLLALALSNWLIGGFLGPLLFRDSAKRMPTAQGKVCINICSLCPNLLNQHPLNMT